MENKVNKKDEELKLTQRQKDLYTFLSTDKNRWFTEREICEGVSGYNYREYTSTSTTHCAAIFEDKNAINKFIDTEYSGIIVMNKHKFKIASKEEYKRERNAHIRALKNQVEFVKSLDAKNSMNGWQELPVGECSEILEEAERIYNVYGY